LKRDRLKVVLFDIDGTLIRTGRAGSRAMSRAFEDVFGVANAFEGIQMAGRTDRWILEDAAVRAGVELTAASDRQFRQRYFDRLVEALPEPGPRKGVLPGVQPLLNTLTTTSDVFLGLLTGNCEQGARIKLEYFDLWRFFRCGAFGDDVHDRNDLFEVALAQTAALGVSVASPADVIVVGDTELDVRCAKGAGAWSVAVATGPVDAETLKRSGADVVVEDLRDTADFLRLLRLSS
jgi:phosphoglycolate phosphatase